MVSVVDSFYDLERAPAPAVDAFVAGELTGCLIELRVPNQERVGDFRP